MAGNFWQSSHYQQWLLDKQDLVRDRQGDLKLLENETDYAKLMIFFANVIQTLGEQVKVRQQVIATATVYFKRFYARNSLKSIDPLLMAPTCIFLASKVEEFGVLSNNRLISTCQQVGCGVWLHGQADGGICPGHISETVRWRKFILGTNIVRKMSWAYPQEFPYNIKNILECEFYLLEMMDCCLILYHPYRPLLQYAQDLASEDSALLKLAWRIINDSLRTDVCLLYPPYTLALGALYMASVIQNKDTKLWFAELNVDMDKILEITKQILALYDMWNSYNEETEIPTLLSRIPKPKLSASRPPSQGPNGQENQGQGQNSQGHSGQGQGSQG